MELTTNDTSIALWQDVIREAENKCAVKLDQALESYLVRLLNFYSNKPAFINRIIATAFLESFDLPEQQRHYSLKEIGDQCLIFAGLFPKLAERKRVSLTYFVSMGRTAYTSISDTSNDLYNSLAVEFVLLMDVLQSIRPNNDLLPLEAYEQWQELGSLRAYKILQTYKSTSRDV